MQHYVSVKDAAKVLGRTVQAVYMLKHKGKLKPSGGDRRLQFSIDELHRFMRSYSTASTSR